MNNAFNNPQIDVEHLPKIENLDFKSIDKNYLLVSLISNSIFCLFLAVGLFIFLTSDPLNLPEWMNAAMLGGFCFFILFTFFAVIRGFKEKGYAIRDKDISYKTGWLWKSLTVVPFNRIQHSEVKEGLIERFFGLSSLHVYTAGGSSSDLSVPGLKTAHANAIKELVLEKINTEIEANDA